MTDKRIKRLLAAGFIFLTLLFVAGAHVAGTDRRLDRFYHWDGIGELIHSLSALITEEKLGVGAYVIVWEARRVVMDSGLSIVDTALPEYRNTLRTPEFWDKAFQYVFTADPTAFVAHPRYNKEAPPYDGIQVLGTGLDVGFVDFLKYSFKLFGKNLSALYNFYFLLTLSSILLFSAEFKRSPITLAVAPLFPLALWAVMTSPLFGAEMEDIIWGSVNNPRFLSTLSVVPALHIVMRLQDARPFERYPDFIPLILQSAVLAFIITVRSTAAWSLIAMGAGAVAGIGWTWQRRGMACIPRRLVFVPAIVLSVVVAGQLLVSWKAHPSFTQNDGSFRHLFWPALYLNLQNHPGWVKKFGPSHDGLQGDSAWTLAFNRSVERHAPGGKDTVMAPSEEIRFRLVDKYVRIAYLELAIENPKYILELYFYHVPIRILTFLRDIPSVALERLNPTYYTAIGSYLFLVALAAWRTRGAAVQSLFAAGSIGVALLSSVVPVWLVFLSEASLADAMFLAMMGALWLAVCLVAGIVVGLKTTFRRGSI